MTLDEALRIAAQLVFLWVGFSTLMLWLRRRDRTRRDIFLVFLSLCVAIFAQDLLLFFPSLGRLPTAIFYTAILVQPYLVLRVAAYSLPIPAAIRKSARLGLLAAAAVAWLLLFGPSPILAGGVVILYFIIVEGYATFLLARGASTIFGLSRRRLRLAAIGSGLLVLVFLLSLASLLLGRPVLSAGPAAPFLRILLSLLTMASGITYFLGFAPPRWLRRAWQLEELQDFLHKLSGNGLQPDGVLERLPSAAMRAVAGVGAALAHSNPEGSQLTLDIPGSGPLIISEPARLPGEIGQVWRDHQSRLVDLPAQLGLQVDAWSKPLHPQSLYAVPVIGPTRAWGLLLVALRYLPLFSEDDLALLELFCEQAVMHLEQSSLLERWQAANQELQERVTEQSRSEEKFRAVLASAPDGMVIIDRSGRIVLSNAQAGRHFGCPPDELIGKPLESLFPGESRQHFQTNLAEVRAHPPGRPRIIAADNMQALRGDGSLLPVEVSLNPVHAGDEMLTVVAVHDLTHRFQAEKKFRGLLESAPDAVVVVDDRGGIQLANSQAEKMFGFDRTEMIGHSIEMLVPRRFQKKHMKHREGYYGEHPARPMGAGLDLYAVRKNGSEFPVEISLSPLEFEEGLLISAAIRDVTQRKRFEEEIQQLNADLQQRASQLEAANKELESFSYSVSHDLRAPLRSIDGFSQALLEDYAGQLPEEGLNYLQRVRAAAQRMAELIDDLLNLSRVTRASLKPRFMNLSQMAEEIVTRLREQDRERQVDVKITPDLMVTADPHLIRIVMDNLLSNAWKFTSKREHARIEFGQLNHVTERTFFIRDNGVGFNMAYVDKLFGVFQRLHSVSDYPGTGVGLATVQRIIKIHGGRIWAEAAEGKGATFFFTL